MCCLALSWWINVGICYQFNGIARYYVLHLCVNYGRATFTVLVVMEYGQMTA